MLREKLPAGRHGSRPSTPKPEIGRSVGRGYLPPPIRVKLTAPPFWLCFWHAERETSRWPTWIKTLNPQARDRAVRRARLLAAPDPRQADCASVLALFLAC